MVKNAIRNKEQTRALLKPNGGNDEAQRQTTTDNENRQGGSAPLKIDHLIQDTSIKAAKSKEYPTGCNLATANQTGYLNQGCRPDPHPLHGADRKFKYEGTSPFKGYRLTFLQPNLGT